ncbi:MAG: ParB/RepB/Spo0J family partition protein [Ottowia sp.]|nr:ParB/RepB/Spo0J family partition protein [Ottowia sp.]
MRQKKGLGRGLEVLLGAPIESIVASPQDGTLMALDLEKLQPGKYQPRTHMDEGALQELAASIRAQGLMQPILVREISPDRYEIIAGERRYRAAKIAGLRQVPALIKAVPDESAAAMALIENIQREDLNPLEEAQGIDRLIQEFAFSHEQAAEAVGRSRSAVSNLLRLLNLAAPVQTMLIAGDLDMGHARALLSVDAASQINLANQVVSRRLSVRETEKLVTRFTATNEGDAPRGQISVHRDQQRLQEELSDLLGLEVFLKLAAKGRGQLVIQFNSLDELDGVLIKLRGPVAA